MIRVALIGALFCAAASSLAQGFGRFGYKDSWSIPALVLDREGFKTDFGAADKFYFPRPLTQWKPIASSPMQQTVSATPFAGAPSKLRQELTAPGFSLYFDIGIDLKVSSLNSPFVSWTDRGSLDGNSDYPTPEVKWALISFRDNQPPILLTFPWKPCAIRIKGKSGAWRITSEGPWQGWARVVAPTGILPRRTNDVSQLGALVEEIKANEEFWSQVPPNATGLSVADDDASVTAEWTFDRAGAVIPDPVTMAPFAGYNVTVLTKTRRLEAPTLDGPLVITDEPKLTVRFPARRIPTGRVVAVGPPPQSLSTASYLDPAGVSELALANLLSPAPKSLRSISETTYAEFLTNAAYHTEPFTNQPLPYAADGKGLDLTAAHALLMQSTISVSRATSEGNSLLTSLIWRRDWLSWRVWSDNSDISRRASALGAIAASLAPEPERRLDGAMLEAGLRGEQGARVWRRRSGFAEGPPLLEVMDTARADIYLPDDYRRSTGLGKVLLSELRSYGNVPVTLTSDASGLYLSMTFTEKKNEVVTLGSSFPIEIEGAATNGQVTATQGFGLTVLTVSPTAAGEVKQKIKIPAWAKLPTMPKDIRYEESKK